MQDFNVEPLFGVLHQRLEQLSADPFAAHLIFNDDGKEAGVDLLFVRLDVKIGHSARNAVPDGCHAGLDLRIAHPDAHGVFDLAHIVHREPAQDLRVGEPLCEMGRVFKLRKAYCQLVHGVLKIAFVKDAGVVAAGVFHKLLLAGKFLKIELLQEADERVSFKNLDVHQFEMEVVFGQMLQVFEQ